MRDGIGPSGGIELCENRGNVEFCGVNRDCELPRNHLIGGAFGEQFEHFEFARRQSAVIVFIDTPQAAGRSNRKTVQHGVDGHA